MPPSGAMDKYAHTVANYLVGNEADAATIEMTYQGITATFDEDDVIAITGADMSPSLNGESIGTWRPSPSTLATNSSWRLRPKAHVRISLSPAGSTSPK